jgi:hypothetical membrane protein
VPLPALFIPVLGIVLDVVAIGVDFWDAKSASDHYSQIEWLLANLGEGMTFDEFVANCWLLIAGAFLWTWLMLAIAFPKRGPRGARGRWAR